MDGCLYQGCLAFASVVLPQSISVFPVAHTYSETTSDAFMNPEKSLCFYGDVYYSYTMKQLSW